MSTMEVAAAVASLNQSVRQLDARIEDLAASIREERRALLEILQDIHAAVAHK